MVRPPARSPSSPTMKSPRTGASTRAAAWAPRATLACAPGAMLACAPGATPTTSAASAMRSAPPTARALLGPTQTATGTLARAIRCPSASSRRSDTTAPPLFSWMTNASTRARSASRSDVAMKSTSTGSMSPVTSITSTRPAAANAGGGSARRVPSASNTLASVRNGCTNLREGTRLDPAGFCSQTRLVIVAGKGGVGKTTVTAALARMAAGTGLSTLIVEVEGKSGLASTFDAGELTYEETVLHPGGPGAAEVRARTLTPDDALLEYLVD